MRLALKIGYNISRKTSAMKRTLNTTINRSKNEKNDEHYTQLVDGVSVSFEREFDAYGWLARFARIGGEESMFGYSPHGAISAVSNGNVAVEYAFTGDALDAGYALAVQGGADFSREVFRHDYLRSCIVAVSNHCGNASHGLQYSYDALQRPILRNDDSFAYNVRGEVVFSRRGEMHLSRERSGCLSEANLEETARGCENAEATYSYDDIGNLVSNSLAEITNLYVSNNRNQYAAIQEISTLSASPRETSYDLDGNMTRHGEWTYAYDSGNRLVSVASNGITVATMSYDTQGRRVKKVAADGTHRYFYDGWLLVYEHITRFDNTISEIEYVWGKDLSGTLHGAAGVGGLLYLTISNAQPSTFNLSTFQRSRGTRDSSTPQLYIPYYDAYGNILGYRDAQGNVVASYTYDAFGNTISQSGPMSDFFLHRFSTKYYDSETGLYYYGYCYYSPSLMRWLTRDPIEEAGGVNLYAMCGNNAVAQIDSLGEAVKIITNSQPVRKKNIIYRVGMDSYRIRAITRNLDTFRFSCGKNCVLHVNGEIRLWIELLDENSDMWLDRRPQYLESPENREDLRTLAHEMDHYKTWKALFDFVSTANSLDGVRYSDCRERAARYNAKYLRYRKETAKHSQKFDEYGWNTGNQYSNHPLDTSKFKWE